MSKKSRRWMTWLATILTVIVVGGLCSVIGVVAYDCIALEMCP